MDYLPLILCCVNFIYQKEDEPHTENSQIYLHPLQSYGLANNTVSVGKNLLGFPKK